MGRKLPLPAELAAHAERQTWFNQQDTGLVMDWLEREELPLWGADAARKLDDGNWMLLIDPMLTTVLGGPNPPLETPELRAQSIREGRAFISSNPELMFEPVWPGY